MKKKPSNTIKTSSEAPKKDKARSPVKYSYKNVSSVMLTDKKKIEAFLKKENTRVFNRMKERNIKISDVLKLNKFHQQQFLNGKLKSDSFRYGFFMKKGKKQMFNFSKSYKINSK